MVFHRELSPFSNFHTAPFTIDNQQFPISEHYVQYNKAIYFGDTYTANAMLNCSTPHEAKRLSHQINGMNPDVWRESAYDICLKGVFEKFHQNPDLLNMLRTTAPLTIAEASNDRIWGTEFC